MQDPDKPTSKLVWIKPSNQLGCIWHRAIRMLTTTYCTFPTLFTDAMEICIGKSLISDAYLDCVGKRHIEFLLLPTQLRPCWQKVWKTHWREQKFLPKERESFADACFPNGKK